MAAQVSDSAFVRQLVSQCGASEEGSVSSQQLLRELYSFGLDINGNDHLSAIRDRLNEMGALRDDKQLTPEALGYIFQNNGKGTTSGGLLVQRALSKKLVVPDWAEFCGRLKAIYHEIAQLDALQTDKSLPNFRENAQYIPELANVDPTKFAISVCTVDGQTWSYGDVSDQFCIQSCCKPINYLLARKLRGKEKVNQHIGFEPSGHLFNNLSLKDHPDRPGVKIPHNPLINAGAIMSCSLIKPEASMADRFKHVMGTWRKLFGNRDPGFDNPVYLSEKATADRNWCLAYMMKEEGAFEKGVSLQNTLEFYFQCCSITANCQNMATMAASLASGGQCPMTHEQIFEPDDVRDCLSQMQFSGMYDYSGEWGYKIGMPAKSGVGGCVYVVLPNKMGIAIWSPPLDSVGNSFKSVEFCKKLVQTFNFHLFDTLSGVANKNDPTVSAKHMKRTDVTEILFIAAEGDLKELVHATSTNPEILFAADYDKRTAMHLAACEGNADILEWILKEAQRTGGDERRLAVANCRDRWNNTPLDEAMANKSEECVRILKASGGAATPGKAAATAMDTDDF